MVLDLVTKHLKLKRVRKWLGLGVAIFTIGLFVTGAYLSSLKPDSHCLVPHTPTSQPPTSLNSANDYFLMGDYEYEKGNCAEAIRNYDRVTAFSK